jgi:hypothetical protein
MAINVRKEFEKREAAKPSTPKPPVQTSTANQRESRTPAPTQTLNLYGTPATSARTRGAVDDSSSKRGGSKIPAAKTSEQIAADAQKILDELNAISGRLDARATSGGAVGPAAGAAAGADAGASAGKKEVIPNVAYDTIQKILESYRITGLASVLETIRDEYPEISSTELITLLQFDPRYNAKFNERFAANVARQKAGKPVYSPGEYLALEQGFQKVFDSYNLPTFKTQAYYDKFIETDVDVVDVTERVQLAYDRILGDVATKSAFQKFFSSLGFSDIVAGMLDPVNQLPALQQKVKAAEIGGAAIRQGLTASELAATEAQTNVGYTNVTRGTLGAGVLAGQGVTKAEAEAGYKDIAQILPTAEKLSSIYGGTEQQYGRLEAEQERLQGLASAQRKRQRLSELEMAQFTGRSGLGKGALKATPII